MPEVLTRRALNRATLERQSLLERSALPVPEVVERVAGLQAQTPHTWYVGLWSRIRDFDPEAAAGLLEDRTLVRIALMRSTIHLVTARDCLRWRPLVEPIIERVTQGAFGRRLRDLDLDAVAAAGREILDERPMTFGALGKELASLFPGRDAAALAQVVRARVALVQVPPRGMWGRSGPIAHTSAERWLGAPQAAEPSVEDFVTRYLAAFGPATVMDVQAHCGLTRLREVIEPMGLRVFRNEEGRELYDLPDAPRPAEDTPAPVRFLYDYDNALLSFADRGRMGVLDPGQVGRAWPEHGPVPGPVLVDGTVAATWATAREGGTTVLTVTPFITLTARHRAETEAEGERLLRMLAPTASHDVRVAAPW
ncbi:winged helix DNA-binding domain-containing protein [Streptosporangium sp. NPDC048865]|uniref:winged helix DNA-binding domain-containing protein n=1 Tax=Streptosporangium sp. NPDC048865 TaxID=3155766 RepID=UPI003424D715